MYIAYMLNCKNLYVNLSIFIKVLHKFKNQIIFFVLKLAINKCQTQPKIINTITLLQTLRIKSNLSFSMNIILKLI